jgi:hypothetical protein
MRYPIVLQIVGFMTLASLGTAFSGWIQDRPSIQQGRTLEPQELREI